MSPREQCDRLLYWLVNRRGNSDAFISAIREMLVSLAPHWLRDVNDSSPEDVQELARWVDEHLEGGRPMQQQIGG